VLNIVKFKDWELKHSITDHKNSFVSKTDQNQLSLELFFYLAACMIMQNRMLKTKCIIMRGEISALEEENKVLHFPKFMLSLKPWN
jgi:hypothetical protein